MHRAVLLLPLPWHSRNPLKLDLTVQTVEKGQVAVDSLPGLSLLYSADCNLPTSTLLFVYFLTEYSAPLALRVSSVIAMWGANAFTTIFEVCLISMAWSLGYP